MQKNLIQLYSIKGGNKEIFKNVKKNVTLLIDFYFGSFKILFIII